MFVLMVCLGCQWHMQPSNEENQTDEVVIERFDRVEIPYLTMADFASLHQMRTDYPVQTRTLIENVLRLGPVNDPDINSRLLRGMNENKSFRRELGLEVWAKQAMLCHGISWDCL